MFLSDTRRAQRYAKGRAIRESRDGAPGEAQAATARTPSSIVASASDLRGSGRAPPRRVEADARAGGCSASGLGFFGAISRTTSRHVRLARSAPDRRRSRNGGVLDRQAGTPSPGSRPRAGEGCSHHRRRRVQGVHREPRIGRPGARDPAQVPRAHETSRRHAESRGYVMLDRDHGGGRRSPERQERLTRILKDAFSDKRKLTAIRGGRA